jgi:glutamine---fructose-6-phosphate transaminase (isomerizing)
MCGIFGLVNAGVSPLAVSDLKRVTSRLFRLSETRGKEASGLAVLSSGDASHWDVVKSPLPASRLLTTREYETFLATAFNGAEQPRSGALFGHTRLVTNGSQLDDDNNQPVICDDTIGVHNGIIVNEDQLWNAHAELTRKTEVDTEVLLALIRSYRRGGDSPAAAVAHAFSRIEGCASVAVTFADSNLLMLATNNGSLYYATDGEGPWYFASENFILQRFLKSRIGIDLSRYRITQVQPNEGLAVSVIDGGMTSFSLTEPLSPSGSPETRPTAARRIRISSIGKSAGVRSVFASQAITAPPRFERHHARTKLAVDRLRRCRRCVLPETVPFIEFDAAGVCNFCSNYKHVEIWGRDALEAVLKPYRKPGRERECVVALSGGRDSCYGLHYLVKELGIKPIAYTYDWGMVTDLARRNMSRVCARLGVEHILISADIPRKRENIRKNVRAWLQKPHLGMVPLFMAGDKQFVWYANRVKRQTGLELDIFSFNLMEKTPFKEEFTGIQFWRPGEDSDQLGESLGVRRGLKLCTFYGSQFMRNRGYWNRSLLDTLHGFVAYYVMPQTFIPLLRYIDWREEHVNQLLRDEYDWELASDTASTWRIGDGTAPFYNYIYYTLAGFSEHDTLRANQIREGHLGREEALALVERDNAPRWASMKWYCDTIGLDFESTIDRINEIQDRAGLLRGSLSVVSAGA